MKHLECEGETVFRPARARRSSATPWAGSYRVKSGKGSHLPQGTIRSSHLSARASSKALLAVESRGTKPDRFPCIVPVLILLCHLGPFRPDIRNARDWSRFRAAHDCLATPRYPGFRSLRYRARRRSRSSIDDIAAGGPGLSAFGAHSAFSFCANAEADTADHHTDTGRRAFLNNPASFRGRFLNDVIVGKARRNHQSCRVAPLKTARMSISSNL